MINRQWLLASRPTGQVRETHFTRHEARVPSVQEGECLIRTLYLSFDPAMRGWMTANPGYVPPIEVGTVMRASGIGQVVESLHAGFKTGDLVLGLLGWQEHTLIGDPGSARLEKITPTHPLPAYLGVLGMTGLTGYFGLLALGQPKTGETVVVSGAAGATGSVAAQIALIKGCRVVGIAGGPDKCRWLTDDLHLDGAIDYKSEDVSARLGALCPSGIDIYFDNVGGPILEAAIGQMALRGRIPVCGMISGYNAEHPLPGPRNLFYLIVRRVRMEGFLVLDYVEHFAEARRDLSAWLDAGRLTSREDIQHGFENIPSTFLRLFTGANTGKQLLQLADPE